MLYIGSMDKMTLELSSGSITHLPFSNLIVRTSPLGILSKTVSPCWIVLSGSTDILEGPSPTSIL